MSDLAHDPVLCTRDSHVCGLKSCVRIASALWPTWGVSGRAGSQTRICSFGRYRVVRVGTVEQYPNEASAQKAVAALRAAINTESPRTSLTPISVQTLIEHYREKQLGTNCSKTRKTQITYEGYFNKWILPRWGSYRVTEVKAVAEQWLRSLLYATEAKPKPETSRSG